jgi:hypothetical protein
MAITPMSRPILHAIAPRFGGPCLRGFLPICGVIVSFLTMPRLAVMITRCPENAVSQRAVSPSAGQSVVPRRKVGNGAWAGIAIDGSERLLWVLWRTCCRIRYAPTVALP